MIRSNRKKTDGFVFPAPFAGLVVLTAALALVYVWLCCRCDALGSDIKVLETDRVSLGKQYLNEEYRWTRLKHPDNMEQVLARLQIKMAWPNRNQVVHLHDLPLPADDRLMPRDAATLSYVRRSRDVMND